MKFLDRLFRRESNPPSGTPKREEPPRPAVSEKPVVPGKAFPQPAGWTERMRIQLDQAKKGDTSAYVNIMDLIFENPIPMNDPRMSLKEVTLLLTCNPRFTPPREIAAVETAGEYQRYHEVLRDLVSEAKKVITGFPSSGISGANVDTIFDAAGYELNIMNGRGLHDHAEILVHHLDVAVDVAKGRSATERLCAEKSPLTSNILHKMKNKHDFFIKTGVCTDYREEKISFAAEREMAAKELQQRGNPPYDPGNYFLH